MKTRDTFRHLFDKAKASVRCPIPGILLCSALFVAATIPSATASVTVGEFRYRSINGDMDLVTPGYQLSRGYNNTFNSTTDFLLVAVGWESATTTVPLASVSYGGVPMNLLRSLEITAPGFVSQNLALYYLENPLQSSLAVVADWAPSTHPGFIGAPNATGPGQFIFVTSFDNVTELPTVYDFTNLRGNSITLDRPATSEPTLYYDIVLHGTSVANSGGGLFPGLTQSGGQTSIFVEPDNGVTSMNLAVTSQLTSDSISHTYSYGAPDNYIQSVGLAFIPEPSGALLLGITGVLGILRRRRLD